MNIIWATIEPPYPPNSGGRILVHNRIKALSETGHRIYLFTFTDEDPDLVRNIDLDNVSVFVYRRRNKLFRALMRPHMPYPSATRIDSTMLDDLKRCIARNRVDIVVVEHATLSPLFASVQIPKCLVVHTIEHDMFLSIAARETTLMRKVMYGLQGYLMKKLEINNYAKRLFDFYLFVSPHEYHWAIRQFPELKDMSVVATTGGIQIRPVVVSSPPEAKGGRKWIVITGK